MTKHTCLYSGIEFETKDNNHRDSYKSGYIDGVRECEPFMWEWISAEERMPTEDGRYLVVEDHVTTWVGVATMRQGEFDIPIKYWMPLPSVPKEEKNEN